VTSVANSANANDSWSYQYDGLSQLIAATNVGNAANNQAYTYDTVGNMLSQSGVGASTYPAAGQPRPHAPLAVGGQAMTYDAFFGWPSSGRTGNLLSGRCRRFSIAPLIHVFADRRSDDQGACLGWREPPDRDHGERRQRDVHLCS
jgi:hypothetical protein